MIFVVELSLINMFVECCICKNRKVNDIACDEKKKNKPWFDYEWKKACDSYYRVHNKMKLSIVKSRKINLKKNIEMFEFSHIEEKVWTLWYYS